MLISVSECFAEIPLTPLTATCIRRAAQTYRVPIEILLAVLATERGKIGEVNQNKNGTVDVGPMQINTVHFEDAKKWGLTPEMLTNNGCANFIFGTWYLSTLLAKYDTWEAIGIYHSRTPYYKARYQNRAWKRFHELDIRELLHEINGPLMPKPKKRLTYYDPRSGRIIDEQAKHP